MPDESPPAIIPSWADATVARASRIIGGVWGRYAGAGSSLWTPLRIILAMACLTLILGYVEKSPCANGDWSGNKQYTHSCYSDIVPLWSAERLDVGNAPYRDNAVEYPVLVGGFMWVTQALTNGAHALFSSVATVEFFGGFSCLLLAACGLIAVAGTVGSAGRRPYDAALFALSPLLVFHAFSNWDLFAMAFASAAMWAWARHKPIAAGVLIGLGTAAKLYPVFLLVPILLLAVRTGKYRPAVWCTVTAVATWIAVNATIAGAYYDGWREFYAFSGTRGAEASTVWYMGHYLLTVGFNGGSPRNWAPPGSVLVLVLLAVLALVAWLTLAAPTKPRLAQIAFLAVLAFLITSKVWSPQYSVWLVPLAALARPRWRLNLVWQFSEIAVWIATMLLLLGYVDANHGIQYGWLMILLLVRDAMLLVMAGFVVHEMWHPDKDVVRASGLDDPAGGIYDGAEDLWRHEPELELDEVAVPG